MEFSFSNATETFGLVDDFAGVGVILVPTILGLRGECKGAVEGDPLVEELVGAGGEGMGCVRFPGGGGDAFGLEFGEGDGACLEPDGGGDSRTGGGGEFSGGLEDGGG